VPPDSAKEEVEASYPFDKGVFLSYYQLLSLYRMTFDINDANFLPFISRISFIIWPLPMLLIGLFDNIIPIA
jgi:ABC-type microcin C transport system permease subunit YejB